MDCSIRTSVGQSSLTTHHSFSQLTTSFFGSQCQGIRPALFLALPFVFPEFSLKYIVVFLPDLISYSKIVSFHLIVFPHIFDIQFSRFSFIFCHQVIECVILLTTFNILFDIDITLSILFQEQKLIDNFFYFLFIY